MLSRVRKNDRGRMVGKPITPPVVLRDMAEQSRDVADSGTAARQERPLMQLVLSKQDRNAQ